MTELSHSLYNDFPQYRDRIDQLKRESEDFARMAAEYHEIDHRIERLEKSGVPVADGTFEELKYRRLHLKDKLFQLLQSR